MAFLKLNKEHATTVQIGKNTLDLWANDDDELYVETPDWGGVTVTVSGEDESDVTVSGQWVTIKPLEKPGE